MPKGSNQKMKILYLAKLFLEETDENKGLTMSEILAKLMAMGVKAERKSIYEDIEALRFIGMDIGFLDGEKKFAYALLSRQFDLAEVKMLVDSVQSAKFLTEQKSQELIKKLETLTSLEEAKKLHRQVYTSGRVKSMTGSVFYHVDAIQSAIGKNVQIRFQYWQWNEKKQMVKRHNGAFYLVSPWALIWDDENYYLVAYDGKEKMLKHFRVDKMCEISHTQLPREGKSAYDKRGTGAYTKHIFSMYAGEVRKVTLELENRLAGVMIDRFGQDILLIPADKGHVHVTVEVAVSNQFFGWVISLGPGVRILSPEDVVEQLREQIHRLEETYQ